jgi:hypothetical protein
MSKNTKIEIYKTNFTFVYMSLKLDAYLKGKNRLSVFKMGTEETTVLKRQE